jgi:acyl carrier protein
VTGTFAEPRLRALVADTLGVDADDLSLDISLVDDLAADSLDLAELVVRVESELGITIADRAVERIRTYGELVRAALAAFGAMSARSTPELMAVRARLVSPHGELRRVETFGPYTAETIVADALAAGRGADLELTLPAEATDGDLDRIRARFAWLVDRGIGLHVGRDDGGRRSFAA